MPTLVKGSLVVYSLSHILLLTFNYKVVCLLTAWEKIFIWEKDINNILFNKI